MQAKKGETRNRVLGTELVYINWRREARRKYNSRLL